LWILTKIMVDLHRAASHLRPRPGVWALYGAVAVEIGVLAEGFFEYNLGDSEVLTMFLVAVTCGYVLNWNALQESSTRTPCVQELLVSPAAAVGQAS
jgi:hypothetical protein